MTKVAFVTGITGMDGSYLAEFLLKKQYAVYGMVRRSSILNTERIEHLLTPSTYNSPEWAKSFRENFYLVYGDLTDGGSVGRLIQEIQPDEIYNFGAQSHVKISFDQPEYTMNVNAIGNLRVLEAVRSTGVKTKVYQSSSSEMFGNSLVVPQNEHTPFCPCSPYGTSKATAFWQTVNYRKSYQVFASNGILFNHESPTRSENFVTRKITRTATRIKLGLRDQLVLGNLEAKRDWGYAPEYVEVIWRILQHDKPDDFVISTGEMHSVKEFLEAVFDYLQLDPYKYLKVDSRYFRPVELHNLQGDSTKARKILGWEPKVKFNELVKIMVDADLELAKQEKILENS